MIYFRAVSVSVRGLPGMPKIVIPMLRGPLKRVEVEAVTLASAWDKGIWKDAHGYRENGIQRIDDPEEVLAA